MDLNKLKIASGLFGIYVGRVNSKETEWLEKRDCTDEALCAVRDYLKGEADSKNKSKCGYEWTTKDGKVVELFVNIRDKE